MRSVISTYESTMPMDLRIERNALVEKAVETTKSGLVQNKFTKANFMKALQYRV